MKSLRISCQLFLYHTMERLLWRGTILLLRLFGDFPLVFLFGSNNSAHSTKPAPPFLNLSVRTAQPCSSPAPRRASSHPLQNRVPRVQVLLPLPKKSGIAFAVPDFFVSERKDLAARWCGIKKVDSLFSRIS